MAKILKRLLAVTLALSMTMSMLSMTSLAVEGEEGAPTHAHAQLDCATCEGTGTVSEVTDCPDCDGPYEPETVLCEDCGGEGAYLDTVPDGKWYVECPECHGVNSTPQGCGATHEDGSPACYFGLYLEIFTCETCGGTGEVTLPGLSDCEKCGGEGKTTRKYWTFDVPCPNGGEACNGCEDCNHGYAWLYEDVTCTACNGFGVVAPEGADVCATCGGIGSMTTQNACAACAGTGKVDCTGAFDDGKLTKNDDGTGTVTYTCATCGASYTESRTHEEVVAALGNEGHVISGEATDHKDPTCAEEGYDKYVCAADGCGAEFTVPVAKLGHSFKNHVCENCGALSFTIYGSRMGYACHYNGNPNAGAETYGYKGPAFGTDHTLTMENLGREDDRFGMFGEFVTNYATHKTWQCVGFVPAGSDYDAKDCLKLTYTNNKNAGDFQYAESLDAVKNVIAEKGGVLYGAAPADNSFIGRSGIVAVWFIDDLPVKAGQFVEEVGEYGLNVEPVAAPAEKENSTGVSIGIDPDSVVYVPASGSHAQGNYVRGSYTVDLVIRIDENAPNNVHVNLAPGLAAAQEAILPKNGGAGFQPGDRVILNISIDNQSGRTYSYVPGSGFVATDPYANDYSDATVAGTGFDGFQIPLVSNSQYSYIARRTDNQPLKDLGLGRNVTDEAVGAALKLLGYGADSELSNEQIAQTYLADYYLDWTNAARSIQGLEPVSSFQDLGLAELSVFTNGDSGVQVFESCENVVEGLYYFYYGAACTYNGKTIYQQMVDYVNGVSELETAIPAALNGADYDLNTLELDGEHVNNGYQNTQFSFRMEFDLSYTPPTIPPTTYTSLTVNKAWAGDNEESRPDSVTVQLYRDGAAYGQPRTLNEANGWSTTWSSLNEDYTWTVEEVNVPEGYTASQSRIGTTVTITNTYTVPEPTPTPTGTPEVTETPTPEPTEPSEELEENDTPLTENPETSEPPVEPEVTQEPEESEELEENDTPLADVPQTGDMLWLWLALALLSAAGLIWVSLGEKRGKRVTK